ncbi:murein hydrolase activator EnvC [Uliginosibacterium sp. sgz301328]|uniref:murein hydrolase activator EnvC family protein n=1 Tax=Uliginosibacterium sp. sgz301328 TaxID=3243764 RepID=UPI00359E04AA
MSTAQAAAADDKRDELKSLQDQIKLLQRDISRGEETRADAASDLAGAERAVSNAQRRLRELTQSKAEREAELQRLQAEQGRMEAEIARQRKQLGDVIYRMYVEGGQAGARRLLSGDDPNQLSRDAYYLEQIARQRAQAIDEARVAMKNLQQVIALVEAERAQVAELEGQRKAEQDKLVEERKRQREILAQASEELRAKRREMASLQRDQARLEKLIKGLDEIARKAAAARAKAAAAAAAAASRSSSSTSSVATAQSSSGRTPPKAAGEPVVGRAETVAQAGGPDVDFGRLKGRLHWPVKGELTGRFGAPRAGGGTSWRGVFIRSAQGTEVHAVAGGTVAYADWLRGFGNLIIIDHGDGYMTIYGNNESLYKTPGQLVKTGETIASVGASGGAEESGLYFEIRYRGEPSDPARWVAGR